MKDLALHRALRGALSGEGAHVEIQAVGQAVLLRQVVGSWTPPIGRPDLVGVRPR